MKKIILIIVCLFGSINFLKAQSWLWASNAMGTSNDISYNLSADANGNVYLTGFFYGPSITFGSITLTNSLSSTSDIFLVKYDGAGNVLWARSAGGTQSDASWNISTDAIGNAYIAGYFTSGTITFGSTILTNMDSSSGADVFVVKYDTLGNVLWAKGAGGIYDDRAHGIAADMNGSVIVAGEFFSPTITFGTTTLNNTGFYDLFIVKYDSSGNVLWANSIGGSSYDEITNVSVVADSVIYLTGNFMSPLLTIGSTTLSNTGVKDIFLVKYNGAGSVLWAKGIGGTSNDFSWSVSSDINRNVYVSGYFSSPSITIGSTTLFNAGSEDVIALKYDGMGNLVWAMSAGGINMDEGWGIISDINGNAYLTGYFDGPSITFGNTILSNAGLSDIFVVKYDGIGNVQWAISVSGTSDEGGSDIDLDPNGSVYLGGNFNSPVLAFGSTVLSASGGADVFVAKLDTTIIITGNSQTENFVSLSSLSPNPTTNELRIDPEYSGLRIREIEIYNTLGEKRLTLTLSKGEGVRVDVSSLPAGVYFVAVTDDKGNKITRRFIKM